MLLPRRARCRARGELARAGSSSSDHHESAWSRRTSGWNCTPQAECRADAWRPALRQQHARVRDLDGVGVLVVRAEPLRQDAEHRVTLALGVSTVSWKPTSAGSIRPTGQPSACASVWAPRQIPSTRLLVLDPAAERAVFLVQPRMLELLADVLGTAEHEHCVEAVGRCALVADVPLDELVAVLGDHVAEHLRPDGRPVDDREHAHQAFGTDSSSSSLRSRAAPAGACATPSVWLLLLKNAYASSAAPASSRSGSAHPRSSSSA